MARVSFSMISTSMPARRACPRRLRARAAPGPPAARRAPLAGARAARRRRVARDADRQVRARVYAVFDEILDVVERDRVDARRRCRGPDGRTACPRRVGSAAVPCRAPPRCWLAGPATSAFSCASLSRLKSSSRKPGSRSCGSTMSSERLPVVPVDRAGEGRHLLVHLRVEARRHRVERLVDLVDPHGPSSRPRRSWPAASAARPSLPFGSWAEPAVKRSLTSSCGSARLLRR